TSGSSASPCATTCRSSTGPSAGRRRSTARSWRAAGPRRSTGPPSPSNVEPPKERSTQMFSNQSQAELRQAIRRLLVLMAMGDGTIHPSEVRILQKIYLHATGVELSESDLLDEISDIQMHGADLESYLVS